MIIKKDRVRSQPEICFKIDTSSDPTPENTVQPLSSPTESQPQKCKQRNFLDEDIKYNVAIHQDEFEIFLNGIPELAAVVEKFGFFSLITKVRTERKRFK